MNLSLPKRNFGWPIVSYGCNYGDPVGTGCRIGGGTHNSPYTRSARVLVSRPRPRPAAQLFYTGDKFPGVAGQLFRRRTRRQDAVALRTERQGTAIVGQEPFFAGVHEIRDLKQGPDGWIYLISRNANQILRIER